jgi:hypothetical protein
MSSRIPHPVQATKDRIQIVTVTGWVSGSGPVAPVNMTGNLIPSMGTDNGARAVYGSSSLGLPSGSVAVLLSADNKFPAVLSWHVSMQRSGTDVYSNPLAQDGINDYRIVPYFSTSTGSQNTFAFGFQRISASLAAVGADDFGFNADGPVASQSSSFSYVGAVPRDPIRPSSPACTWTLTAIVRNTDR